MTTLMALCFCIMGAGVMHAQDIAPLSDAPGFAGQLVDLYREALGPSAAARRPADAFHTSPSTHLGSSGT